MKTQVNVHEAKTHLSRLLERAHAGEEIILAKAGKPYARLVPLEPLPEKRQLGFLKGMVTDDFFDPLPEEELALWEDGPVFPEETMGERNAISA
jgi:prevent-host-death family protein